MGITLILAVVAVLFALGLGIVVGWRRGLGAGFVTGLVVLVAAVVGYVVMLSSPM